MASSYQCQRQVEFFDTDMAGIAHFSSFFRFMEEAEHEFLRSVGLSVFIEDDQGRLSWPRVSVSCDFSGPARFEDLLDIQLRIAKLGRTSVTYRFDITTSGRLVAVGRLTAVCCRLHEGAPPEPVPIPAWIREQIEPDPSLADS